MALCFSLGGLTLPFADSGRGRRSRSAPQGCWTRPRIDDVIVLENCYNENL